jgi:hypothetical protein
LHQSRFYAGIHISYGIHLLHPCGGPEVRNTPFGCYFVPAYECFGISLLDFHLNYAGQARSEMRCELARYVP